MYQDETPISSSEKQNLQFILTKNSITYL